MIGDTDWGEPPEDHLAYKEVLQALIQLLRDYRTRVGDVCFKKEVYSQCFYALVMKSERMQVFEFGKFAMQRLTGYDPDSGNACDSVPSKILEEAERALKMLEEQVPKVATAA